MSKFVLRNNAKEILSVISIPQIKSKIIQNRVISSALFKHSQNIGIYLPYKTEVDTSIIIESIFEHNKHCYLPRLTNGTEMNFYLVNDYKDIFDFATNRFGIKEPPITEHSLDGLDLIIVPGLAFDWDNNRLGRGKGYYDRYLGRLHSNNANPYLLGLCYSEQIIRTLPIESWDIKMDGVIID